MQKKNFCNLLAIFMVAMLSFGFVSCSSDDEEVENRVENPEDNLPEKAKAFIGYWKNIDTNDRSLYCFLFLPNGKCKRIDYWGNLTDTGYWTFDEKTNILATTNGDFRSHPWQWQITLSNNEAWVGILLGDNKSDAYRKGYDWEFAKGYLMGTTWACGDTAFVNVNRGGTFSLTKSDVVKKNFKSGYYNLLKNAVVTKTEITADVEYVYSDSEKVFSFTVKNWASSKPILTIKGSKQVYSLKE